MPARTNRTPRARRAAAGVLTGGLLVALGACTSTASRPAAGGSGRPAGPSAVVLHRDAAPLVLAAGAEPSTVAVAVSRALFDRSPVAVVAVAGDTVGTQQAAAQAERLGVPLLLAPAPPAAPAPASTAPAAPADPALLAELARLHAGAVLAVGAVGPLPGATASADALPAVRRAQPLPRTVVVHAVGDAGVLAGAAAAGATARAAGATVVPVIGEDVRADASAVQALGRAPKQLVVAGDGFGPAALLGDRLATAATGTELPGGGQVLFPGHRLVALYGAPGSKALGVLGEQGLPATITRARTVASAYDRLSDVPVVPTFEIIATVASGSPGKDGDYSSESTVAALQPWVDQAGRAGIYVVLDLQPGRADFLTQARRYAPLLQEPWVGLALDSEWRLTPDQVPLVQIGSVDVDEVNGVVTWLADLVKASHLPQKLLVLHQFQLHMIRGESRLDTGRDELALLVHMDGQGAPRLKDGTWSAVTRAAPPGVSFGWKDFYDEDTPMLTPAQTMQRRPTPVMISYQ